MARFGEVAYHDEISGIKNLCESQKGAIVVTARVSAQRKRICVVVVSVGYITNTPDV
jgi:hypothetical protein